MNDETPPRKTLSPEILPTPDADASGSVRDRTQRRLAALLRASALGGSALGFAGLYGCDRMPEPVTCQDVDTAQRINDLSASATFDGEHLVFTAYVNYLENLTFSDDVVATGGTIARVDASSQNQLEVKLNPEDGVTDLTLDGSLLCGEAATAWTATLKIRSGSTGHYLVDVTIE